MLINLYSLPPLAASLVNLFLVGLVIGKGPKNRVNQVWAFLSLCLATWSFGTFMLYLSPSALTALVWLKFYNLGLVLIPATFVHFALVFSGAESKQVKRVAGLAYLFSFGFLLLSLTPFFNSGVQRYSWGFYPSPGSLNWIYDVFFLAAPIIVAKLMISDFMNSGPRKKNQYKYVFLAMIIAFGSSISNFLPIYGNKVYPLGHFGILLTGLIISFAIIKYQLMDISIIIRRSAVYSVLTALVTAAYVAVVFIIQSAFQGLTGYKSTLPVIVVAIVIAISFEPARRYVQVVIDKLFFRQKYEYQKVLKQASEALHAEVMPSDIGSVVLGTLASTMQVKSAWLMVYDSNASNYQVVTAINMVAHARQALRIDPDSALVRYLEKSTEPVWTEDLEANILRRGIDKELRGQFKKSGVTLICPLQGKSGLVGFMFLGEKKSGDAYNHNDIELIATLGKQAGVSIENSRLFDELQASYLNTVKSLVAALEAKDEYTKGHSERVAGYAHAIALEMKLPEKEARLLYEVSLLHDVGKIGVSEQILNKKGKLSKAEFQHIQSHTIIGEKILSNVGSIKDGLSAVRHHHERLNGDGYPDGLSEVSIPLNARILAVADSYDAMTTKRPYRNAMTKREAIQELKDCSGQQFDTKVVRAFISVIMQSQEPYQGQSTLPLGRTTRHHLKTA